MKPITFSPFDDLYGSLTLNRPESPADWECDQLFDPEAAFWREQESHTPRPAVSLWYKPREGPTLESLRRKIISWLGASGHPISEELVFVVMAFSVVLHRDYGGPTGFFGELAKLIATADVQHAAIVADCDKTIEGRFNVAGFAYGSLDGSNLADRCREAGSTHFSRVAAGLSGKPALESPAYKRELIDFATMCWRKKGTGVATILRDLLEEYFQQIAKAHIKMMWNQLEQVLLVSAALTGGVVSIRQLEDIPGLCYFSIYQNFGIEHSHGHVGLQYHQQGSMLPKPLLVEKTFEDLENTYRVSKLLTSPFYNLIQTVALSISRGWAHVYAGRLDEAFLFMIIALEQVFSERTETAQAVASRTAIVTYRRFEKPFDDMQKDLLRLYGRRSRLVHGGVAVGYADFEYAHKVTTCVLETLLRFSRDRGEGPSNDAQDVQRDWLKKLDFIKAAIDAGEPIERDLLTKCGIDT